MRRLIPLGSLLLACSSDPTSLVYTVELVDATGADPSAGYTRLTVEGHADGVTQMETYELGEELDERLTLPESAVGEVQLRLRLSGAEEAGDLVGAPPDFTLGETGGLVRVPMVPAGECTEIEGWRLLSATRSTGWLRAGTFIAGFAGQGSAQVRYLDLLRAEGGELPEGGDFEGPSRAENLGDSAALVVGDGGAYRYDLGVAGSRVIPLTLHPGAGYASALARYSDSVVVAGGGDANGLTVVAENGTTQAFTMTGARADAAAIVLGQSALIVGGDRDGLDIVDLGTGAARQVSTGDGVRRRPLLVSLGAELFVFGGTDETDAVRRDTVVLRGCPAACVAAPGPTWEAAREGVVLAPDPADPERTLVVGGDRIEELAVGVSGVSFTEVRALEPARRDPGAWLLASGMVLIVGGTASTGAALTRVDLCAPSPLRPVVDTAME